MSVTETVLEKLANNIHAIVGYMMLAQTGSGADYAHDRHNCQAETIFNYAGGSYDKCRIDPQSLPAANISEV